MSSTKHLEGTWCSGDLPFLITNGVRNGQRELWKLMLDLPCLPVLSPAIGSLSLSPFWMKSTHMPISQKLFVTLKNSAQMETERRRRKKKSRVWLSLVPCLTCMRRTTHLCPDVRSCRSQRARPQRLVCPYGPASRGRVTASSSKQPEA